MLVPSLAPELVLQLSICSPRDVESYRHTCGRNGKLRGVCVSLLMYLDTRTYESCAHARDSG